MKDAIVELRHELHRAAERSGQEKATAERLKSELESRKPDRIVTDLGGHGIIAEFQGEEDGPTVLLRTDMDALPLPDDPNLPYASQTEHTAHLCGHDGHMATMVSVADALAENRPERGRVLLLFQPAEETGAGARKVLDDPNFKPFQPDVAIAQHNLPGYELGTVVLRKGVFASASRGLIVELEGQSSHAAEPEAGRSPVSAACTLAQNLVALPQRKSALHEVAQVTIVGMEVGGPAFGTNPGAGRVMATLRTHREKVMERLAQAATEYAKNLARAEGLDCTVSWTEEFPSTPNDSATVELIAQAAKDLDMKVVYADQPFAWSEDFGHFTHEGVGALFGLGSGTDQPALHAGGYDFPDELLAPGQALFARIAQLCLENPPTGGKS